MLKIILQNNKTTKDKIIRPSINLTTILFLKTNITRHYSIQKPNKIIFSQINQSLALIN